MEYAETTALIKDKLNEALNLITEAQILSEKIGGASTPLSKAINKGYDTVAKAHDMRM
jgi:hypothetical protein